jgi:hypothetical protein
MAERVYAALARVAFTSTSAGGRSLHRLGPLRIRIQAPRELVYEILSAPYLGRARNESIDVLARRESLVVASHLTKIHFYLGRWVVPQWHRVVADHLDTVKARAEQRAQRARSRDAADGPGRAE